MSGITRDDLFASERRRDWTLHHCYVSTPGVTRERREPGSPVRMNRRLIRVDDGKPNNLCPEPMCLSNCEIPDHASEPAPSRHRVDDHPPQSSNRPGDGEVKVPDQLAG